MNLYKASSQWANRPDDERFSSLPDMLASARYYRESAVSSTIKLNSLTVAPVLGTDGASEVVIRGEHNQARLTHFAFGQLARFAGAPAAYLRSLPAALVCQNLNHTLPTSDATGQLLMHKNGDLVARCITGEQYGRIWNTDIIDRLMGLQSDGWQVPPARPVRHNQAGSRPATDADVLDGRSHGLSINIGDLIAPAGLYASDHDMFAFMVNEDRRIEDGSEGGLSRGFFCENSEVGDGACAVTTFFYRHVCGNHIVWGASNVTNTRIVHRRNAATRFSNEFLVELRKYADESANEDEAKIVAAKRHVIAADKDSVIDALFGKKILSRRDLGLAYDSAERDEGDTVAPNTVWGMVQGITRLAQDTAYADDRTAIDRAAGKVLEMAF